MTDQEALLAAIVDNPKDTNRRRIYADWLEEHGDPKASVHRKTADYLDVISPKSLATVENSLTQANGKRKTRLLDISDVMDCVLEAAKDGWCAVGGGNVANSYFKVGYSASQTVCVAAKREDGKVRVACAVGNARKGSSLIRPVTHRHLNEWANEELSLVEFICHLLTENKAGLTIPQIAERVNYLSSSGHNVVAYTQQALHRLKRDNLVRKNGLAYILNGKD